jgi:hypothetical protein
LDGGPDLLCGRLGKGREFITRDKISCGFRPDYLLGGIILPGGRAFSGGYRRYGTHRRFTAFEASYGNRGGREAFYPLLCVGGLSDLLKFGDLLDELIDVVLVISAL